AHRTPPPPAPAPRHSPPPHAPPPRSPPPSAPRPGFPSPPAPRPRPDPVRPVPPPSRRLSEPARPRPPPRVCLPEPPPEPRPAGFPPRRRGVSPATLSSALPAADSALSGGLSRTRYFPRPGLPARRRPTPASTPAKQARAHSSEGRLR